MTPRTTTKKRLIGYIRVSRKNGRSGPSYLSPDIQREAIEAWARAHGVEIVAWVEEENRSGGAGKRRPEFEALLARVENREADGIVVWKMSRFGRSLVEAALRIQKIEEVGGVVESTEGAQSKLTRNIMLAIAEDELERLTETWAIAQERALEAGVWVGRVPFGFARAGKREKLSEHPHEGPIVREAFRIAARDGIAAAVAYLRGAAPERNWTTDSARKLLRSRVYLGEVWIGGKTTERVTEREAHPALTTLEDFTAAQSAPRPRRANGAYPLSGIARCACCGRGLVGQLQSIHGRTYRRYRCKTASCKGGSSINADKLDALAYGALVEALSDEDFRASFTPGDLTSARETVERAEHELDSFVEAVPASSRAFARGYALREQELDAAQTAFQEIASQAATSELLPTAKQLSDPVKFDAALRAMVDRIVVARGRGSIDERVRLRWTQRPNALDNGAGTLAA